MHHRVKNDDLRLHVQNPTARRRIGWKDIVYQEILLQHIQPLGKIGLIRTCSEKVNYWG